MASKSSQFQSQLSFDDDDDFQIPLTQIPLTQIPSATTTSVASSAAKSRSTRSLKQPLKPCSSTSKKPNKLNGGLYFGQENVEFARPDGLDFSFEEGISLDSMPSSFDFTSGDGDSEDAILRVDDAKKGFVIDGGYMEKSIESRLMQKRVADCGIANSEAGLGGSDTVSHFEETTELDVLLKLCSSGRNVDLLEENLGNGLGCGTGDEAVGLVQCPLCGVDISVLSHELRQVHTNDCLDKDQNQGQGIVLMKDIMVSDIQPLAVDSGAQSPCRVVDLSPTIKWLRNLGLERYEDTFVREEIDWDTLRWLTEEDIFNMGIRALGPRKKIVHALSELRKGCAHVIQTHTDVHAPGIRESPATDGPEQCDDASTTTAAETSKPTASKLITDYFPGFTGSKKIRTTLSGQGRSERCSSDSVRKHVTRKPAKGGKSRDIPVWSCIPGTPFRVDAFKYLRGDCSHWFLTHFHMDHYQGLTKSFCHGKIYCSLITAKLVNLKIGIPWNRMHVLPLNEKISISGIGVTCLDANHCPGAIIILFEPPNGKAVLHTGDFRFSEEMAGMFLLRSCPIHTLILDTTYCDPQYDFPKQEAIIQFVIEAIQAETFNPRTLFLIGSYTIGKERLFLEVARVLQRKVYVPATKFRLLECLGFSEEDMQWFTLNELESHIHVVSMWSLASFKRLKHLSNHYAKRFSLIVAISPTGWSFGKGKKKSTGRRWQQGTIIRYEVPYSEHSSFSELKEIVKLVSPDKIIPSVNNYGPESADAMVSLLLS